MTGLGPDVLRGSFPPLVTPFRGNEVDLDTYRSLVEFQVGSGSHGIVVAGTSGEPGSLSVAERMALAEVAVNAADGHIPVVVATGALSIAETIALTRHAESAGASAVLVVTPPFTRAPQRGLIEYYKTVCRATTLPVLMYHIPGRSGTRVEVDTVRQIATSCGNFVGVKHASTDLAWVTDVLLALGPEFRVLVGLEELSFPMLAVGASGLVNAVGNVFPGVLVQLYESIRAGDLFEARRLHLALWEINKAVFFDTNPIPIKYMMRSRGLLPSLDERLPMVPADTRVQRRCDEVLSQFTPA